MSNPKFKTTYSATMNCAIINKTIHKKQQQKGKNMKSLLPKHPKNKRFLVIMILSIIASTTIPFGLIAVANHQPSWLFDNFDSVFIRSTETSTNRTWRISAHLGNGSRTRRINFDQNSLDNITLSSNSAEGSIYAIFSQNETSKQIDITNFQETLDMSAFVPGRIHIQLLFQDAANFNINMHW